MNARTLVVPLLFACGAAYAGQVTSSSTANAVSGVEFSYDIGTDLWGEQYGMLEYGVWNLPEGLTSNGKTISGRFNESTADGGTYSTTVYFSVYDPTQNESAEGSVEIFVATAKQVTSNPSVSARQVALGSTVTLTREGSAFNGIGHTEAWVFRPDGETSYLGFSGLGSTSFAVNGGRGQYIYYLLVTDTAGRGILRWTTFSVGQVTLPLITSGGIGYTSGQFPELAVGKSATFQFTAMAQDSQIGSVTLSGSAGLSTWLPSAGPFAPAYTIGGTGTLRADRRGNGTQTVTFNLTNANDGLVWTHPFTVPVVRGTGALRMVPASLAPTNGFRILQANDLGATIVNAHSGVVDSIEPGSAEFRLANSYTLLTPGVVLPIGRYVVDGFFLGDNNYLPGTTARSTLEVGGLPAPTSVQAVQTAPGVVTLTWRSTQPSTLVYRDGSPTALPGVNWIGDTWTLVDNAAGPNSVYEIVAVNMTWRSVGTTVTVNRFEVFTPTQ